MKLLLRDVEVDGHRTDVAIDHGHITSLTRGATPTGTDVVVVAGDGGALVPGLHDHHVHLLALAAALASVAVGPEDVDGRDGFSAALRGADRQLAAGEWLRAVRYHERVAGDLDRWALDARVPERPVRVQHRSGAVWVVNTTGLRALGLLDGPIPAGCEVGDDGAPTGRLWRLDDWLADRIGAAPPDLAPVGRRLLAQGITGLTDMTPFASAERLHVLADAVAHGTLPQRVTITGAPALDISSVPAGLGIGPAKILLHDHDLPSLDELLARMHTARAAGRALAVHCVTRVALVLTLAALDEVGCLPGDRIEHGAVVPHELYGALRAGGLTIVTQPNFVAERGDDYLADVASEDRDILWPCASLSHAGIAVAAGTDAPFGRADPWALIAAAASRRTPSGALLGAEERVTAAEALAMMLTDPLRPGGPVRRVEVGATADVCLLDAPLADALARAPSNPVRAVIVGGELHTDVG